MRLDVFLAQEGYLSSRTEAKNMIEEGAVYVCGKPVRKPSFDVTGFEDSVKVDFSKKKYVSRGGIKLEGALAEFGVSPLGKKCLDVGASSGGFTDCLLQRGAAHVVAVDSGSGQMAEVLRVDGRVSVVENYNARYMKREDLPYAPELTVMDVSFISATYVIPAVYDCLAPGGDFICLIKPQFEVGRGGLGKGGIVKDEKVRLSAVKKVTDFAAEQGFSLIKVAKSPIKGGDGNTEFLAHFVKGVKEGECDEERGNNSQR